MRSIIFPKSSAYLDIEKYIISKGEFSTAEIEYLFGENIRSSFVKKYLTAGAIERTRHGLYRNRFKQIIADRIKRDKAILEDLQ